MTVGGGGSRRWDEGNRKKSALRVADDGTAATEEGV